MIWAMGRVFWGVLWLIAAEIGFELAFWIDPEGMRWWMEQG